MADVDTKDVELVVRFTSQPKVSLAMYRRAQDHAVAAEFLLRDTSAHTLIGEHGTDAGHEWLSQQRGLSDTFTAEQKLAQRVVDLEAELAALRATTSTRTAELEQKAAHQRLKLLRAARRVKDLLRGQGSFIDVLVQQVRATTDIP